MTTFDVVIAGGGVAGSATALSLLNHEPGLRVAVVERGAREGVRVGETLPPHAAILLRRLEVWESFLEQGHLPAAGTCAAWGSAELSFNESVFTAYGAGWHLDRGEFDRWIASHAERRGATVLRNTSVGKPRRRGNGWEVAVSGGAAALLRASILVDATGRRAVVARGRGARRLRDDRLLGAYLFFSERGGSVDTLTLVEARAEGWCYSASLPGGGLAAAFMTDADISRQRRLADRDGLLGALKEAPHTAARIASALPSTGPVVRSAASQRLDRVAGDGWLAVGDAASTFDPLSSLGIFKALRGGILGSYAVLDHLRGEPRGLAAYARAVVAEFDAYLAKRVEYYSAEHRWPESPFWCRRRRTAEPTTFSRDGRQASGGTWPLANPISPAGAHHAR